MIMCRINEVSIQRTLINNGVEEQVKGLKGINEVVSRISDRGSN